jgi:hypothetical protein
MKMQEEQRKDYSQVAVGDLTVEGRLAINTVRLAQTYLQNPTAQLRNPGRRNRAYSRRAWRRRQGCPQHRATLRADGREHEHREEEEGARDVPAASTTST